MSWIQYYVSLLLLIFLSLNETRAESECDSFNIEKWSCKDYQKHFSDRNVAKTLSCLGYGKISNIPSDIRLKRKIRELLKVDEYEGYLTMYEAIEVMYTENMLNFSLCNVTRLDPYLPPYSLLFWHPDFDESSETLFVTQLDLALLYLNGRIKLKSLNPANTKIRCQMDYEWYPFDSQICPHPIVLDEELKSVNFQFDVGKMLEKSDIEKAYHPDWSVQLKPNDCPERDEKRQKVCFSVDLILKRKTSNHILHVFVPSIMLSIASGTSLFIPSEYMPARMGLSVTTCLSMITLFVNAQ